MVRSSDDNYGRIFFSTLFAHANREQASSNLSKVLDSPNNLQIYSLHLRNLFPK